MLAFPQLHIFYLQAEDAVDPERHYDLFSVVVHIGGYLPAFSLSFSCVCVLVVVMMIESRAEIVVSFSN